MSPEVVQLGRQLASTMEERTARQIQPGFFIGVICFCVLVFVVRYSDSCFGCHVIFIDSGAF